MSDIEKANKLLGDRDAESEATSKLQDEIQELKKRRKEDQFFVIFFFIIIVDAMLFIFLVDGLAALSLVIIELVFLVIIADRFDISQIEILFARIANIFNKQ